MFSFNSPLGACPECEGFGKVIGIDEHLVIPNRALSVYDGAVTVSYTHLIKLPEYIHAIKNLSSAVETEPLNWQILSRLSLIHI